MNIAERLASHRNDQKIIRLQLGPLFFFFCFVLRSIPSFRWMEIKFFSVGKYFYLLVCIWESLLSYKSS